jgi:hypothetical protein
MADGVGRQWKKRSRMSLKSELEALIFKHDHALEVAREKLNRVRADLTYYKKANKKRKIEIDKLKCQLAKEKFHAKKLEEKN